MQDWTEAEPRAVPSCIGTHQHEDGDVTPACLNGTENLALTEIQYKKGCTCATTPGYDN